MKPFLDLASFYLDGKPIFYKLRRILELLFLFSASAYLYTCFVGPYEFFDYKDYKGLLGFIFSGRFIVPLSIFLCVYGLSWLVATTFVAYFVELKAVKVQREIVQVHVPLPEFVQGLAIFAHLSRYLTHHNLSPQKILVLYRENKSMFRQAITEMEQVATTEKLVMKENFLFAIRALIAAICAYAAAAGFPLLLLILILLFLLIYLATLASGCFILDIIPVFVAKFCALADAFPDSHLDLVPEPVLLEEQTSTASI